MCSGQCRRFAVSEKAGNSKLLICSRNGGGGGLLHPSPIFFLFCKDGHMVGNWRPKHFYKFSPLLYRLTVNAFFTTGTVYVSIYLLLEKAWPFI